MIKGTRRQMIVLRTDESRFFDTAYFVLRERALKEHSHKDILREANKMLREGGGEAGQRHKGSARAGFGIGALCGSVATALILLLLLSLWQGGIFF